jgi:hypothetical protein
MRFRFQSAPSGGLSIAPVLPLGGGDGGELEAFFLRYCSQLQSSPILRSLAARTHAGIWFANQPSHTRLRRNGPGHNITALMLRQIYV